MRAGLALYVLPLQLAVALIFISIGVGWPGAIVLSIVLLVAARCAVIATVEFHNVFSNRAHSSLPWLRLIGGGALIGGGLTLMLLNGAVAFAPAVLGAWCAARARTCWHFGTGAACLALGLLALTAFGAQHAAPICFIAIQAASAGATMIAMSLPTPNGRPAEALGSHRSFRAHELSA
ncbi:MAG TPA: hypothetical protein VFO00_01985 [Vitreimonas sp.]|nr:hypothetical protein [Vitreimonas sp.]